jgi:hypothetical protein
VTGDPEVKGYAYAAGQRALAEHLERAGVDARMQYGAKPGQYRVVHRVREDATAALLLVAEGAPPAGLREAGESWLRSTHESWGLALAGSDEDVAAWTAALPDALVRDRLDPAVEGSAEFLVFLSEPVEAVTPEWLARLVGYAGEAGVGAAGGKTLAPDGRVEHAGVVVARGLPLPALHGCPPEVGGPVAITEIASNFAALSGTVATSRAIFELLGGLDAALRSLALPDYCLRAHERGLRVVSVPDAIGRRLPGTAPTNDLAALVGFRRRWGHRLPRDPYLNPNFLDHRGDYAPRASLA